MRSGNGKNSNASSKRQLSRESKRDERNFPWQLQNRNRNRNRPTEDRSVRSEGIKIIVRSTRRGGKSATSRLSHPCQKLDLRNDGEWMSNGESCHPGCWICGCFGHRRDHQDRLEALDRCRGERDRGKGIEPSGSTAAIMAWKEKTPTVSVSDERSMWTSPLRP